MWQRLKNIYHAVLALLAVFYFGFPGKRLKVVGVTGTDGKTTTTHLIHHILKSAGKKASMVSSVYAEMGGTKYDTGFHVTTPDPWKIQKFLREAANDGEEYMILEVTSHGIDQNRVWGINFDIGILTNVTHEHLDYHRTYRSYVKTKERLLHQSKIAVVNNDDESFRYIDPSLHQKMVTYGLNNAHLTPDSFPFETSLPGEYNRYNCLAAISVAKQLGIADEMIRKAVKSFKGVKGRFEIIETGKGFDVIIDFAHTPNAIEKVLSTIKPRAEDRLIHVFGSAGLRDRTKRPIMGEMSAKYADLIVLTEEDYRTEDVHVIIDEIAQGCLKQGAQELNPEEFKITAEVKSPVFFRVPDRKSAVMFAIQKLARSGDTVILTGKAHEKSLCRGKIEFPWNEHEAVKKALSER